MFAEATGITGHPAADRRIPAQTVVDISPVLLFGKEEYATHGKYTALDQYTFTWKCGQQALALGLGKTPLGFPCVSLGRVTRASSVTIAITDFRRRSCRHNNLGSLFNHSLTPNLNYIRDYNTGSIVYTTSREVEEGEELCTFYGTKLWFKDVNTKDDRSVLEDSEDREGHPFSKMMDLDSDVDVEDRGKVVTEEELPFEALDISNLMQEEDFESVRTGGVTVRRLCVIRLTAIQWMSGLSTLRIRDTPPRC